MTRRPPERERGERERKKESQRERERESGREREREREKDGEGERGRGREGERERGRGGEGERGRGKALISGTYTCHESTLQQKPMAILQGREPCRVPPAPFMAILQGRRSYKAGSLSGTRYPRGQGRDRAALGLL